MYACYCRVSTRRQKNDRQRAEIQRWLTNHRIRKSLVRWYEDRESGTSLQRPALDRMQRAIFEGEVDTVVVWKLDRISRRQHEGISLLAAWCERGVRVVVVTQQIDLKIYPTVQRIFETAMALPEFASAHPLAQPDTPEAMRKK